jgi:hypothetical protein
MVHQRHAGLFGGEQREDRSSAHLRGPSLPVAINGAVHAEERRSAPGRAGARGKAPLPPSMSPRR